MQAHANANASDAVDQGADTGNGSAGARFHGLTWDHPRGFNALAAAAREVAPRGLLRWSKQPLEGFESHPIGDLAARFDLIVLDHPHIGEAAALSCLRPLEQIFSPEDLSAWSAGAVGPAMASYFWQGKQWALPLDFATQVAARRVDLAPEPPDAWDDVLRLSKRTSVALSLAGPHALMCFFSLALSFGPPPGGDDLVDDATGAAALDVLAELHASAPEGSGTFNPIGLLETMATSDAIAYVPLVYGYVNYAAPAAGRQPVAFGDAPRGPSGRRGSVLGGTGVALTTRASPTPELIDHLRWLMSDEAQLDFIPRRDGQPAARRAWRDEAVNRLSRDFYRDTLATAEEAWLRPRYDGYVRFQTEAGALIRDGLAQGAPSRTVVANLREAWRRSRRNARGPLT
ncbi:MAG: extracellular solute-binding protein [Hyphomicrobiales bacterium]|nr:extracellular solute-binding protein [Hyphomicrobiales bacterium]